MTKSLFSFLFGALMPLYFGGGGGRSASKSDTTITNRNMAGVDNGSLAISADNSTISMLDGGAIAGAFDLVKSNDAYSSRNYESLLQTTSATLKDILGASNDSMSGILSGVASTQNFIASTQATAKGTLDSKTLMVLGLAVAAVLGIYFLKGKA